MDNYSGHNSFLAAEFGLSVGIHPFGLVPNSTNIMQPLDLCIMQPFKQTLLHVIHEIRSKSSLEFVFRQYNIPAAVRSTLTVLSKDTSRGQKAFSETGTKMQTIFA